VALTKTLTAPVKEYAQMLQDHHSEHMQKTMELATKLTVKTDSTDDDVVELKKKHEATMAKLTPMTGMDFERAYLDAMIKDHADALTLIDGELASEADKDEVKAHLKTTRESIVKHLEQAKHLRDRP
jgi:putative membrane protein